MEIFAFRHAESVLDEFERTVASPQFSRSYRKLKYMIGAYAYCDFTQKGQSPGDQEMAWAWEDVQVAFKGHGEPAFHGVIAQMWSNLPKGKKSAFKRAIKAAFKAADAATPPDVERRYRSRWRNKPIRDPDLGFNLPTMRPVFGPKLREWVDSELNDDLSEMEDLEIQMHWLDMQSRDIEFGIHEGSMRRHLILLPGGKDE